MKTEYGMAEEISLIMDAHDVSCPLETKNVIKEINKLYEKSEGHWRL